MTKINKVKVVFKNLKKIDKKIWECVGFIVLLPIVILIEMLGIGKYRRDG